LDEVIQELGVNNSTLELFINHAKYYPGHNKKQKLSTKYKKLLTKYSA